MLSFPKQLIEHRVFSDLPDRLFRRYVELLILAKPQNGRLELPEALAIAHSLDQPVGIILEDLYELRGRGLIIDEPPTRFELALPDPRGRAA